MSTPAQAPRPGGFKLPQVLSNLKLKGMAGPVLIIMILGMMVLPLPAFALDLLFTFNIALAIMVLLVSMYTTEPLEFSSIMFVQTVKAKTSQT